MKTAVYTEFKRFAVHDGPGIRTTMFLKGCSLACRWCHNPETVSDRPELAIHYNKCMKCGDCAKVCPNHKIKGSEHFFDREKCTACGKCAKACVFGALQVYGEKISVNAAAEYLLQDRQFYVNGGGITISGGEPLLQADFCAELFSRMKREGVSCAVDTCGNVPWNAFEKVLSDSDIFLYDLKELDSARHKRFTGCGNGLILENLKLLDETGKPIEIRMIQVPGWNMDKSDIAAAAEFLSGLKHVTAVRLLAYHSLAHSKYRAVGRPDNMPDTSSPTCDDLEKSAEILRVKGLKVINPLEK